MTEIDAIDPSNAALLLIDMQNAFCHDEGTLGISGVDVKPAQATYGPVRQLAEAFANAGRPVIWTRQVHLAADAARKAKALAPHTAKRKQVSALSGSWDAELVDELKDLAADPTFIVTKHRFGSFYQTRLQSLLAMLGVKALFIGGVTANACVETTIREAYLRDYDVVAITDAIAAVRPQWIDTAQQVWAQYFGALATSAEVTTWLNTGVDGPSTPLEGVNGPLTPLGAAAGAPRGVGRLHHVLLEVGDLEASLAFYTSVLGFTIRKREPFRDGRDLVVTEQGLGLVQGTPSRLEHFCFAAKDVDDLASKAVAAGHAVLRGPGPGPYGHTVYLADPDGNQVELAEVEDA